MRAVTLSILCLCASNVFMTFAFMFRGRLAGG